MDSGTRRLQNLPFGWSRVGAVRPIDAAVAAWSAIFVGWLVFAWGGRTWASLFDLVLFAGVAVATAVQQLRVVRLAPSSRDRLAWMLLAASSLSRFVSGGIWGLLVEFSGNHANPAWMTALALAYPAFVIAALLAFPGAPRRNADRLRFGLDASMVILGSLLVVWYAAIGPFLRSAGAADAPLVDIALTIGDAATVILAASLHLRAASRATRDASAFLLVSFVLQVIPDIGFWREGWFATYSAGDAIAGIWYGAWVAKWLAARAAETALLRETPSAPRLEGTYASGWIPHAFLVAAVGLMLLKQVTADHEDRALFALGTAVLAILLVARQSIELRERDRLQEVLSRQELRFRALLQHAYDAVALLDEEYRVRYASPPTERLFGAERMRGGPAVLSLAFHPDDREQLRVALASTASGPRTMTLRLQDAIGEWRTFEGHLQDLRRDPLIGGFVLHGFDRTREVQLAGGLRDARQLEALGVLASGLAHDLNNILTVIASHIELLRDDDALDRDAREELEAIREASDRAQALTHGLLLLSRPKEGAWRVLSLGELASERLARRGAHQPIRDPEDGASPGVRGDPKALAQVVDATLDELARTTPRSTPVVARAVERQLDLAAARRAQLEPGTYAALEIGALFTKPATETEVAVRTSVDGEWDLAPSDLSMLMALATTREAGGTLLRERSDEGTRFSILLPSAAP